nr:hypothetical protein [Cytophagales bacterium]
MKIILLSSLIAFVSLSAAAQVSLAPTTVFADANGIGALFVSNGSDKAQEVTVSFLFGYPGNDPEGNVVMVYDDSIRAERSGLGDRIRTFPSSFILEPGRQRTVRFQIRPDRNKPAGTYFTRVKVYSREQTAAVEDASTDGISAQVSFDMEQIISAFYKYGETSTGLDFSTLEAAKKENSIVVYSEFTVQGNSPYLGSLQAIIRSADGKEVGRQEQTVALYYGGIRTFSIPIPEDLATGTYEVALTFQTTRSDISTSDLVFAEPIVKKLTFSF